MDRNTIIAIVLSVIVITVGMTIQTAFFPPEIPAVAEEGTVVETIDATLPGESGSSIEATGENPDSTPFTVTAGSYAITFDPKGASVSSIKLTEHLDGEEPVELIFKDADDENASVNSEFKDFLNKEYNIVGEFIANGDNDNNIKHEEGVISMARSDYSTYGYASEGYNSAGCQFFIMSADNTDLDGLYAPFGKVIEGMDVVEKVANVEVYYRDSEVDEDFEAPKDEDGETIASDTPKEEPVITSIRVETYGVDYGAPETIVPFDVSTIFSGLYN